MSKVPNEAAVQDKNSSSEEEAKKRLEHIDKLTQRIINEDLSEKEQNALLEEIRDMLNSLIQDMQKKPSYLSQAAKYWYKIPLWQKIIAGLIATAPTLALGIALHVWTLLAIFCITLFIYTGGSILLTDHEQRNNDSTANVTQGVNSLFHLFSTLILATKTLCNDLKEKLNRIEKEVDRHRELNKQFTEKVLEFTEHNQHFGNVSNLFREDVKKIAEETHQLTDEVAKAEAQNKLWGKIFNEYQQLCQLIQETQQKADTLTNELEQDNKKIRELVEVINNLSMQHILPSHASSESNRALGNSIMGAMDKETELLETLAQGVGAVQESINYGLSFFTAASKTESELPPPAYERKH